MLGRSSRPRNDDEGGVHQPLLNDSEEDLPSAAPPPTRTNGHANGDVLFTVDDGSDEDEENQLLSDLNRHTSRAKPERSVRFQEEPEVHVFSTPLRSTQESRETGA